MKSSVLTLLVAPISMVLSGCSLFATKEPDNTIVTQSNRPIQVRHTGIESIRTTPSAILKTTTDEQYVLQVSKPEYRARMETRTRTTPAIKPTPTKVEAVQPQKLIEHGTVQVRFEFDSDQLTDEGERNLDSRMSQFRSANEIEIVGHTDSRGPDAYNLVLSLKRAESVKSFLSARGVRQEKMRIRGDGERHPEADNKTSSGRALNRRVIVVF
jgi:outer membrane protein OmpA-like peptidoglycan-associated protein